ncbi:hypothetical protein J31TS3_15830 [Paenibacillus lactis]|nr:hypothetical protein J31TS3_15830 [Paenibacillus lactis]
MGHGIDEDRQILEVIRDSKIQSGKKGNYLANEQGSSIISLEFSTYVAIYEEHR